MSKKRQQVVDFQTVRLTNIGSREFQFATAKLVMEGAFELDEVRFVEFLPTAYRLESWMALDDLQHSLLHAPPVLSHVDLLPTLAKGDIATGFDEVGEVYVQERAWAVSSVPHLRSEI